MFGIYSRVIDRVVYIFFLYSTVWCLLLFIVNNTHRTKSEVNMCICLFNICFFGYLGQFWVSLLFFVVFVIKDAYDTDFDKLERYVYADGQEISMLTELIFGTYIMIIGTYIGTYFRMFETYLAYIVGLFT